jgi:hypothetical protein
MASKRIILLCPDLRAAAAGAVSERYPGLETVLARGLREDLHRPEFDPLRFEYAGFDCKEPLPVAPVSRIGESEAPEEGLGEYYWLRADPVTLQAGMTQVVMTGRGCQGLYREEQEELAQAVGELMRADGLFFESPARDRWYLRLTESPGFEFPSLQAALGADAAEVTPVHPRAKYWRKLTAEIQMVLHAHPVNSRRRDLGLAPVNSIWFWGGGTAPVARLKPAVDAIVANHPHSRGLARLCGLALHHLEDLGDLDPVGQSWLVDWRLSEAEGQEDGAGLLQDVDDFISSMLPLVARGRMMLQLVADRGRSWTLNYRSVRKFWKKSSPWMAYAD